MNSIQISQWEEKRFFESREEWTNLLNRSTCDKLFMSWEWLSTWWRIFSKSESMSLKLLVAIDSGGLLVGLAPLYIHETKIKKVFKIKRLQFIGQCLNSHKTMRTELQGFIVDNQNIDEVLNCFFEYIYEIDEWDELVLSDMISESPTYLYLHNNEYSKNSYIRTISTLNSYYLKLNKDFSYYCKTLGKNLRVSLLNKRKRLSKLGAIEFSEITNEDSESQFHLLNHLHAKRWGKPAFEGERLEFNLIIADLFKANGNLNFSVIKLDGKVISIQYNYVIDKHEYNIQAGFDEAMSCNISLGYLHFGFELESAYTKGTVVYDFLAGEGKNTQYKRRLTNDSLEVVSTQVVRNKYTKFAYSIYDKLRIFD